MYMVNSIFGGTFKIVNSIVWRQKVGRVRVVSEWYGNDVISFHKFMAPHFFSHAPFFDRSFPLAVPSECSIIIMDIQSSKWWIRKTKKMRKKKFYGTIFLRGRNRWCFGTSIKKEKQHFWCVCYVWCVWKNCLNSICLLIHEITTLVFQWHYFWSLFSLHCCHPHFSMLKVLTKSCMCVYLFA